MKTNIQVGNTPILELTQLEKAFKLKSKVFVKLESANPAGSVKDRIAYYMLMDAFDKKLINQDSTIIEATSGNTGIGLSYIGTSLGLKVKIVMPEHMSKERIALMEHYGAEVILTPKAFGMKGAIAKAKELLQTIPNSFMPDQFNNSANVLAHYQTTGPELTKQLDSIDYVIAGIGTGGTITGIAKYFKSINSATKMIGVEPAESAVLNGMPSGPHGIQGIGAGFIPPLLDQSLLDEIRMVATTDALSLVTKVYQLCGIKVGISSAAAIYQAIEIAKTVEGKIVVAFCPDGGDRYESMGLYQK